MSKYSIKKGRQDIVRKTDQNTPESVKPFADTGGFVSFSYSYKAISFANGKTHIRSGKERFQNGKFESEEFEGITDGNMYMNAVTELQTQFFKQISDFFKYFSFFLPSSPEDKEKNNR